MGRHKAKRQGGGAGHHGDARAFRQGQSPGQTHQGGRTPFIVVGVLESKGSSGWRDRDDMVVIPMSTATQAPEPRRQDQRHARTHEDASRVVQIKAEVTNVA